MITRFLMVRKGCPECRQFVKEVNKANLNLEIDKQIRIIDCWELEEFDLQNIPLAKKLEEEGFEDYPFCYLDGIIVESAPTPEQLKIFLKTFLKDDFLYNQEV